jgi:hypothetical protein
VVTAVKENEDPEVLAERRQMVKTMSPAELAQFSSITDFPVPSRIARVLEPKKAERNKKRRWDATFSGDF